MTPLNTRIERTPDEIEAGVCPVPEDSEVTMHFANGGSHTTELPDFWDWGDLGNDTITTYEVHVLPTPDHGPAILAALRAMPRESWPVIAQGIEGVSDLTADDVIEYLKGDG